MASRLETLEAMACLAFARLLIGLVRFGRWRGLLGRLGHEAPDKGPAPREAFRLARVVKRGVMRLPAEAKCLPQAMALAWMLRRRGMSPVVVIAALPGHARGGLDDLHAWVELGPDVVIGESDMAHKALGRFG